MSADESENAENEVSNNSLTSEQLKKTPKRGIIYISSIPPYMNVSGIREYFGRFGTLGRVFLQLEHTGDRSGKPEGKKKKKRIAKKFTEGWVEFERKSVAKKVVALLNNTQVSDRKKSKQYDYLWSLKYLSGFKWNHLHERLIYEKVARRQRLREEIHKAKTNANYFTSKLGKKKKGEVVNKEFQDLKTTVNSETVENSVNVKSKHLVGTLFS